MHTYICIHTCIYISLYIYICMCIMCMYTYIYVQIGPWLGCIGLRFLDLHGGLTPKAKSQHVGITPGRHSRHQAIGGSTASMFYAGISSMLEGLEGQSMDGIHQVIGGIGSMLLERNQCREQLPKTATVPDLRTTRVYAQPLGGAGVYGEDLHSVLSSYCPFIAGLNKCVKLRCWILPLNFRTTTCIAYIYIYIPICMYIYIYIYVYMCMFVIYVLSLLLLFVHILSIYRSIPIHLSLSLSLSISLPIYIYTLYVHIYIYIYMHTFLFADIGMPRSARRWR